MLNILIQGYKKLYYMIQLSTLKGKASDKVLQIINDSSNPISKADIMEILFSNTQGTIEAALGVLVKEEKIKILQKGHYALYYRK